MASERRRHLLGVGALAATVLLWTSFALTIRGIGASSLTTVDAALLRFLVPVVVLSPWLPRTVRTLRRERPHVVALLVLGGLPHFLVSALGGQLTTAALVGLVIPGSVPLFVTLLGLAGGAERVSAFRGAGLLAIVAGVAACAALSASGHVGAGLGVLLVAGLVWAVYTLGLRQTGLGAVEVVLVICVPSAVVAAMLAGTGVLPSHLLTGTARTGDVALFAALQGIGTGVLSGLCYPVAVRLLGSGAAATAGAISPVVTAVAALPLLGERITPASLVGLLLIVGGVTAFNLASTTGTRATRAERRLPSTPALDGAVALRAAP